MEDKTIDVEEIGIKKLLVDSPAPPFPKTWSILGVVWVTFHILITLFSGEMLAVYSSLFLGLSLIFFLTALGVWPQPRPHPVVKYYVFFLLLILFACTDNGLYYASLFLLPLLTALAFSWLVRGKFYVELSVFLFVLITTGFQVLDLIIELKNPDCALSLPVEPYFYLMFLHVLIPFALKADNIKTKILRSLYLLPSLVLFVFVARLDHTPYPEKYTVPTPGSLVLSLFGKTDVLVYLLLLIFAGVTVLFMFRNKKEQGRWKKHSSYRGLLTGGSILAVMFLTLPSLLKGPLGADYFAYIGLMFGFVFIGRERMIYEDITRHPACKRSSFLDYIDEALIALDSLLGWLAASLRKNSPEVLNQPRKVLSAGGKLYSPYKNGKPVLVPLVMHMHSNRWEGCFTPEELVSHYMDIGFNTVLITDHNRITTTDLSASVIPAYEHGWGPHHHHILVLDAGKQLRDDSPFGGKIESRRETLKRLRAVSGHIVLAHPTHRKAWSKSDVLFLDYDSIELFNKSADSTNRWDKALKGGLLVWGTAGDDCHDPRSRHQTGKRYLLLDVQGYEAPFEENGAIKRDVLLDVLEKGSFFAVRQKSREMTRLVPNPSLPTVENISIDENNVVVRFDRVVEKLLLISNDKESEEFNQCDFIEFSIRPGCSYVRLQLEHGDHILTFNPFAKIATPFTI